MILDLIQTIPAAVCETTCLPAPRGFDDNARSFALWSSFSAAATNWFFRPARQMKKGPAPKRVKTFAIISMTTGIISIILFFIALAQGVTSLLGAAMLFIALASIALSFSRFQQTRETEQNSRRWAPEEYHYHHLENQPHSTSRLEDGTSVSSVVLTSYILGGVAFIIAVGLMILAFIL